VNTLKKLDKFVAEQLAKEVKELRDERAGVQQHVSKLDDFVVEQLSTELKEFHEDKQELVEKKSQNGSRRQKTTCRS